MVPTKAVVRPADRSISSVMNAVVVFPLVPVMPVIASRRSGDP